MIRMEAGARILGLVLVSAQFSLLGCGSSDSVPKQIARAVQELQVGNDRAALIDLQHALDKNPKNAAARLLLAEAELKVGDPAAAHRDLEDARRSGAQVVEAADLQARIELAQGKADQLLKDLASSQGILPEPARAVFRGRALLLLAKNSEAEAAFRDALKGKAAPAEAHTWLAEALTAEGDLDQAAKEVDTALTATPDAAEGWRARAAILAMRGQYPEVQGALEKAVKYAPGQLDLAQRALTLNSLAEVRLTLGNIAGAEAAYRDLLASVREAPLTRVLEGRIALAKKDYPAAVASFRGAVSDMPKDPRARELLGLALLAKGDSKAAADELAEVAEQTPNNLDVRKLLAESRLRSGWAAGAELTLAPVADDNIADPEFNELLSSAQARGGHEFAAVRTLERSARASPNNLDLQLRLAVLYLSAGYANKAIDLLDQLAGRYEHDAGALNRVGALLMASGDLQRADAVLGKALALDPNNAATALAEAQLALRRSDSADARLRLQKICAEHPKALRPCLMLAQLELSEKHDPQASQVIQQILKAASSNARVLDAVGRVYLRTRHFDDALAQFHAAAVLEPANLNFLLDIGSAQLAAGRLEEAEHAATKALDIVPDSVPALRLAVLAELRANHTEAALTRVSMATQRLPNVGPLWELTGDVHFERKEYALAVGAYDKASNHDPSEVLAWKSMRARRAGGVPGEFEPLKRWVSEHPTNADARRRLASAYASAGHSDEAVREYTAILSQSPANVAALNDLAWLYVQSKDPRAVASARRAYELAPNVSEIADTYGWALVQSGQIESGAQVLQRAAAGSSNSSIKVHYAAALAGTGDREGARLILTRVLSGSVSVPDRSAAEQLLHEL
jgi:tetratricopeptide (TPR) repeat protein